MTSSIYLLSLPSKIVPIVIFTILIDNYIHSILNWVVGSKFKQRTHFQQETFLNGNKQFFGLVFTTTRNTFYNCPFLIRIHAIDIPVGTISLLTSKKTTHSTFLFLIHDDDIGFEFSPKNLQ